MWRDLLVSYLTISVVFSVLIATTEEWRVNAEEYPGVGPATARAVFVVLCGIFWPVFLLVSLCGKLFDF